MLLAWTAAPMMMRAAEAVRFKLSVRVEALFPGMPLEKQIHKVSEAGYAAFEFGDWRAADAMALGKLKNRLGLDCACIVGNRSVNPKGMGLCDPAEREGFLAEIRASAEAANRFDTRRIVVLTGFRSARLPSEQQRASVVEGLKRAHDIVARRGVTMLLEPINTVAPVEPLNPKGDNHHAYFLDRPAEAFAIVREVGSPNLRVLYDVYHAQLMEGNLMETIRRNVGLIGHIHIGDVPGRHEPGTGEIHFGNVFRAIRESGFAGYVAMEYVPLRDAVETLREVKPMALGRWGRQR